MLIAPLMLCFALGDEPGVVVTGIGEVKAKPDRLEIEVRNTGSAELAGDAAVKLRDATRRTTEAYARLKVEKLKLEALGVQVTHEAQPQQEVYYPGQQRNNNAPKVEVTRPTRISLTGIDKMSEEETLSLVAKLLDTAKDSGARVGSSTSPPANYYVSMLFGQNGGAGQPSGLVTFTLDDVTAARERAVEAAFADAKARAGRLAKLAGRSLGPVISMTENSTESVESEVGSVRIQAAGGTTADAKKGSRIVANQFMEIPVRVNLQVRFALSP